MEQFGAIVVLIFSVYGVICALRAVMEWIEGDPPCITVLPLKGHHEDVELKIRAAISRHRGRCVVVNMGLDDDTEALVTECCARMELATCCCTDGLTKQLVKVLKEQ